MDGEKEAIATQIRQQGDLVRRLKNEKADAAKVSVKSVKVTVLSDPFQTSFVVLQLVY